MRPAEESAPEELITKRVAFRDDEDHADCWHRRMGIQRGTVLKPAPTLAQKAELLGEDQVLPEELVAAEAEVVRLWVKADPCPAFPRGCEMAAERECLLVLEPGDEAGAGR
jgi:hypothetical protein